MSVNVLGLSVGIAAFILLIQYVAFEKSYDQHLTQIDNLYRVTLTSNLGNKGSTTSATNHPAVGPAMKRDFPEVESYARIVDKSLLFSSTIILSHTNVNGEVIKSDANDYQIHFADNTLLDMFDIPLTSGNPLTALKEPNSIILTKDIANRFFGKEDHLGKIIKLNDGFELEVTGIFDELPKNTHLPLEIVISYSTLGETGRFTDSWVWPEFYNYVKLKSGTDPKKIESKFPAFIQKYMSDIMNEHGFEAKFGLQPVKDIHLKSKMKKEISANASESTLYFLIIVAGFIIVIALINFINLSTAKSMERAKEVGIKKVAGVGRGMLIRQFLYESLTINFFVIILSILLVSLLISPFNSLVGIEVLTLGMWGKWQVWVAITGIFIGGGILAGLYPAFVLSNFIPIEVLRGKFHKNTKGVGLRKALVIAQFAISITLVAGTFIVYNQFTYMQNKDLGFDADHNLVISAPIYSDTTMQGKLKAFKRELIRNPKIKGISISNEIPGRRVTWNNMIRRVHEEKESGVGSALISIDNDFFKTYKVALLAGRDFVEEDARLYLSKEQKTVRVIINNSAAKILGYREPQMAINERIIYAFGSETKAEIIGVVEDYHQQSLAEAYEPMLFLFFPYSSGNHITISIMGGDNMKETIADVETKYKEFFPNDFFKHFFIDEYFNRQYQADLKFGTICLLFSILAIFIAALGLFGLGSHIALQKTKEIGIRKVMGASVPQALALIPKELLSLVLLSGMIAFPVIYFTTDKWLENYAFKVDVGIWMFLLPLFGVLVVAAMSILSQSLKIALINPADTLRNE